MGTVIEARSAGKGIITRKYGKSIIRAKDYSSGIVVLYFVVSIIGSDNIILLEPKFCPAVVEVG